MARRHRARLCDVKSNLWLLAFPLAVLAFVGPAIAYVNVVFTTTVRWGVVAVLAVVLLGSGRAFAILRHGAGIAIVAYLTWCGVTYFWSGVPELTLMKSGAFALVAVGLVAGGQQWVARLGWRRSLDYLFPLLALALFAGAFGQQGIEQPTGSLSLYGGLAGNPNMLGSLMNMAIPLLLWHSYRTRATPRRLVVWLGLLAFVIAVLLMSVSRSSILAAIVTCVAFLAVVGVRRNAVAYAIVVVVAVGAIAAVPDVLTTLEQRYVRKVADDAEGEILGSRRDVWEESYELAVEGGLVGGGFGVTIGDTAFIVGVTAVGYGREKGNSQLAIFEETGVVGFVLYLVVLFTLFRAAAVPVRQSAERDRKVMGAIVLGALAGQIAQSLFEAWWVAPGSPEAAYFWALCGVALGLNADTRRWLAARRRGALPAADEHWHLAAGAGRGRR